MCGNVSRMSSHQLYNAESIRCTARFDDRTLNRFTSFTTGGIESKRTINDPDVVVNF